MKDSEKGAAAKQFRVQRLEFALMLGATRKNRGISGAEMARRLGIKRPNLSRLEAAERPASIELLEKYANELGFRISVEISLLWRGR